MHKIQELFDPSKQLNRKIESVVTFGANTTEDLDHEIREYVVTDKLHKYNPQNEMLPFHKTKCSETQNEASSL